MQRQPEFASGLFQFYKTTYWSISALVAQGLERSIADRQVPRSNRGQSSCFFLLGAIFLDLK